jgi:hypothetical protein
VITKGSGKDVFINAPFDSGYEPLFVTVVCSLVFLRYRPHCVLEVRESGDGRLRRIYELMKACPISVHDMSRSGWPVRFNMPFELGLACSLKLANPRKYDIVVMDASAHRADRTLSDYKGRDLIIHGGTCDGMLMALLDAFSTAGADAAELRRAAREVRRWAREIKRDYRATTLFHPHLFRELVAASNGIARERGFAAS